MIRRVTLPGTAISVSGLCLGTADLGTKIDESTSLLQMHAFLRRGGNFFDTAHAYAAWANATGISERILGKFAREVGRREVVVATKGGHVGFPGYPRPDAFCTPETIQSDIAESLDRLQMDYVDLYYLHRDDPRVPVAELMDALAEQVAKGRARAIAASNWALDRLAEANAYADGNALPRFVAIQNQWSLAEPNFEIGGPGTVRTMRRSDLPALRADGVAAIPWAPNANGFFGTNGAKGKDTYGSEEGFRRLDRTQRLAAKRKQDPGAIALAYLIDDAPVIPITGSTSEKTLDEAVCALELELTEAEKRYLESGVGEP